MKTTFEAQDNDLPSIFLESEERGIGLMAVAKARIHSTALEMSIEISPAELCTFALILVGLEEEKRR